MFLNEFYVKMAHLYRKDQLFVYISCLRVHEYIMKSQDLQNKSALRARSLTSVSDVNFLI